MSAWWRFAWRRALPPEFAWAALAWAVLAASWVGSPTTLWNASRFPSPDPAAAAAVLARPSAWSFIVCGVALLALVRAAWSGPAPARDAASEAWCNARVGPLARTASALAATLAGCGLLVAMAFAAAEFAAWRAGQGAGDARARQSARALLARFETPALPLFESDRPASRTLQPPLAASRSGPALLRARVDFLGGGSAPLVRLSARRDDAVRSVTQRVTDACALEVEVPEGTGVLTVELQRSGAGALVMLARDGFEWVEAGPAGRRVGWGLALRVWLSLSASCALAIGLGAWMRGSLACGCALALALAAWSGEGAWARALPWGLVRTGLDLALDNLAAPAPSARALAWWALALVLGGLTACAGASKGRVRA